jgi:GLPGLI family protein
MKMKRINLILAFMWFITANSQINNCGKVKYVEIFGSSEYLIKYELNFTNNKSTYKKIIEQNDNEYIETINGYVEKEVIPIFNYNTTNKEFIYQLKVALDQVVVVDTLSVLHWDIFEETKKIGDFNCIKAKTTIHKVNYTAWFCPEIPVEFGPWKLRGLPGLILEAHDDSNHYQLYAEKVITNSDCSKTQNIIEKNSLKKSLSWKEFVLRRKNEEKEIEEFYNSQQSRESGSPTTVFFHGFLREILE